MGDGSVLVVGGTGGIGREVARHYHERGHDVTITGRNLERTKMIASEIGADVGALAFDLAEPDTIAEALSGLGPVSRLVLSSIARDNNPIREYTVADADLPDDHEARRLHHDGPCPHRPPLRGQLGGAVRRPSQGPSVSGLHHGDDGQRRCEQPHPYPGHRAGAGAVQRHPSRHRRRQPVLGEQAARRRHPDERRPGASSRWPKSWAPPSSCWRTAESTASTSPSTVAGCCCDVQRR